jgi:dihydropteroate synthase
MQFGTHSLDLSVPRVMGILNITPDSFSDGGELMQRGRPTLSVIIDRAANMIADGAEFLDVGGESTRPGAAQVSEQEELERVIPVIGALASRFACVLSVDTSTSSVIKAAAGAGAGLINDVRALSKPGALSAAAMAGLPVCLMHMQGQPATMQQAPNYQDVLANVCDFLQVRILECEAAGMPRSQLILDPGFGFGKTLQHNLLLLAQLEKLQRLDLPLLVGVSRKRMLGALTGRSEKERVAAGLAAAVVAIQKGARIIRTHDVGATVDAVKVCRALLEYQ